MANRSWLAAHSWQSAELEAVGLVDEVLSYTLCGLQAVSSKL
jgi:hypothetical protein